MVIRIEALDLVLAWYVTIVHRFPTKPLRPIERCQKQTKVVGRRVVAGTSIVGLVAVHVDGRVIAPPVVSARHLPRKPDRARAPDAKPEKGPPTPPSKPYLGRRAWPSSQAPSSRPLRPRSSPH